jgi:SH3-like domain-containing protein
MLKKTRYVIVEKEGNLLKKNDSESSILAIVQPGVIARLEECPKGDYCKISVSDEANTKKGWFPRSSLWGLDKGEVVEH